MKKTRKPGRLSVKRMLLCLFAAFALVLFLAVFVGGRIRTVSVVGCSYYTDEEIEKQMMTDPVTKNTFGLYFTYARGKGISLPFVNQIKVKIQSWNSVEIVISEKIIIGCIKYMGEYLYFDGDGVVVESTTTQQEGIPLIEGVHFRKMNLYEPLEVEEDAVFQEIMGISQLLNKYEIETNKVVFDSKNKVTLYVDDIQVRLGKRDRYDVQIAELSKLLPKARKRQLKGVLDMENFTEGQDQIIFQKETEPKKTVKNKSKKTTNVE